jgi:hypothetical protein
MIKQTITFEDLEGNELTEDFYFNMDKKQLFEFTLETGGIDKIVDDIRSYEGDDGKLEAYNLFKKVVLAAYGRKHDDGIQFIKVDPETGQPLSQQFENHPACSELIIDLLQNDEKALSFISGLFPQKYQQSIREAVEAEIDTPGTGAEKLRKVEDVELPQSGQIEQVNKKFEDYTEAELTSMPREEFDALLPPRGQMTQAQLQMAMKRRTQGQ